MAFKLPKLQIKLPIVDSKGNPVTSFHRYLNIELIGALEDVISSQGASIAQLEAITQQLLITTQQTQEALAIAGLALETADSGGTARSGSATIDDITLTGTGWVTGPQVDLLTVSAGDLQLLGSGIQSDGNTTLGNFNVQMEGEFRIMEVVGGVDTEIAGSPFVITADRYDSNPTGPVFVANDSRVPTFTEARASTGSVSYRMDLRRVTGPVLTNVKAYLFARRTV